jgi:hypothetical protein
MPIAPMAEEVSTVSDEPGAPVPKDAIDPELVKLRGPRPKVGLVTAAGVMFLCGFFALKLNPDRRFAGEPEAPRKVSVADVVSGKVGEDAHVAVDAEPLMAHAIRSATQKGNIGMRVVPARGSAEKLWLVLPGDGYSEPNTSGYVGRLRRLSDMPIAVSIEEFLAKNPRPMFASASAVRASFASNKLTTIDGSSITVRDSDRVSFDVVDPEAATILCSFNPRHTDTAGCAKALGEAGITLSGTPMPAREQTRFSVNVPLKDTDRSTDAVQITRTKLEAAKLWGMTVEPVTVHYDTTWGKLKTSPPSGFTVDTTTIPDFQLDLIGIYVSRSLPDGAVALIGGEKPQDYWYVLPVTILVGLIGLLFTWAFVRAVKRDLLPPKQTA